LGFDLPAFADVSGIRVEETEEFNGLEISGGISTPWAGFGVTTTETTVFSFGEETLNRMKSISLKAISLKLRTLGRQLDLVSFKEKENGDVDLVLTVFETDNVILDKPTIIFEEVIATFKKIDENTYRAYDVKEKKE